jgi:hypothetical protein
VADTTTTTDRSLAEWLAEHTASDLTKVEQELELGRRRRAFVVDELVDAGLSGPTLIDGIVRCTGIDVDEAVALVAARAPERL